jgi:hypothetical protein
MAILAAVALIGGVAAAGLVASRDSRPRVHTGCPKNFSSWTARDGIIDDAIAAARAVVIDHRTETNQARVTRRTRENYALWEVRDGVGSGTSRREAVARCGAKVATFSWVLVFHDGESLIASDRDVRFAVLTPDGWWIY